MRFDYKRTLRDPERQDSNLLIQVIAHHFAGEQTLREVADPFSVKRRGAEQWFPAEYAIGQNVYLVDPTITDGAVVSHTALLGWHYREEWFVNEEIWNRFQWSERVAYVLELVPLVYENGNRGRVEKYVRREVPFNVSPKPSWEDLLDWADDYMMAYWSTRKPHRIGEVLRQSRDALLGASVSSLGKIDDPYIGDGLKNMPALAYLANRSAGAGIVYPRAVMRNTSGGTTEIWTEKGIHKVLETLADRTNTLENARNIISVRHRRLEAIIKDPMGGLGAGATAKEIHTKRLAAFNQLFDESTPKKIDALMLKEANELSKRSGIPDDLPTAVDFLIEQLEATAMARLKYIKGASSQQGVDLPASCAEIDTALTTISTLKDAGFRALANSDTIAAMRAIFDRQAAAINAVEVDNTPEWLDAQNAALTLNTDGKHEIAFVYDPDHAGQNQAVATVRARNPVPSGGGARTTLGEIAIVSRQVSAPFHSTVRAVMQGAETLREVVIDYRGDKAPDAETEGRLVSRNSCGPKALALRVNSTVRPSR